MATIISIAIEKGGVAKTTTTHNLADALALADKRVLMLDLDPQRSLTLWAGYSQHQIDQLDAEERSIYFAMKGADPNSMIVGGPAHLIPGTQLLASMQEFFARDPLNAPYMLRETISRITEPYDFILIDCPPSLGLLTMNALVASNLVLVPTKTDYTSVAGFTDIMNTIREVRRRANPQIKVAGVLPTLYNKGYSEDQTMLDQLTQTSTAAGFRMFAPIPRNTAIDKSASFGKSAVVLYPDAPASKAYVQLAQSILTTTYDQAA